MTDHNMQADDRADIEWRFQYHKPSEKKAVGHMDIRSGCELAAKRIMAICPPGRERSLAITKLEEAMMWGNASLAREKEGDSNNAG